MTTLLTTAQVSKQTGAAVGTVLSWIRAAELPATLLSRRRDSRRPRYGIDPADLEAFLAARRTRPKANVKRKRLSPVTGYMAAAGI